MSEGWHVGIVWPSHLPHVPADWRRVGAGLVVALGGGNAEQLPHEVAAVGLLIRGGLAGPLPGDQHAAAADAEGAAFVDLALAVAGFQPGPAVLGLHAVEQPVGAAFGARGVPQLLPEPSRWARCRSVSGAWQSA